VKPPLSFSSFNDRYRVRKRAVGVLNFLNRHSPREVRRTLRGHWEDAIESDYEIQVRDNLDYLLSAYGLAEILFASFKPAYWMPSLDRWYARTILSNPEIREYYSNTYPIVLPQIFLSRLQRELPQAYAGGWIVGGEPSLIVLSLLELDRQRLNDPFLENFLSLLDGYDYRGWFIDDVVEALGDTKRVRRALEEDVEKEPGSRHGRLMALILSLDAFLRYADELKRFLESSEGTILNSLAWLHHGYFYGESAESVQITLRELRGLLDDMAEGPEQQAIAAARAEHMIDTFDALADRGRWLRPAVEAELGPFLQTLDPSFEPG
jgi:hypothetical protein